MLNFPLINATVSPPASSLNPALLSISSLQLSSSPPPTATSSNNILLLPFPSPSSPRASPPLIRYQKRASPFLLCFASNSGMDAAGGQGVYPLHRTKTLHLVRHAQGIHNVEGEKDHNNYLSEALFDAHLTQHGWQQVDNLHKHVQASGLNKTVELVICSPLLRTMQTAVGVFGGGGYTDGITVPPLMVANAGESNRSAISSLNCPPFVAFELCREHLGVHPCDRRRSISEYRSLFPAIDFSLIENDADILWTPDVREKNEEVAARGQKFLHWLWTRKEREIAVVSHSGFLYHMLSAFGNDCHPTVKSEMCTHFANCELRSMVVVDKGMIGSDPSTTNYPGKVPRGLDLPSDVAEEKHPDKASK